MGSKHIAIVGGGTAGHVVLGLAIAQTYRQMHPEVDVHFIGAPGGYEQRILPKQGQRIDIVSGLPWFGVGRLAKLKAIAELAPGTLQARRILAARGTQLVIGVGSYASAAGLFAARFNGLRSLIVEPNVIPGMTNQWTAHIVDRVHLTHAASERSFPPGRSAITGTPVRPSIAALTERDHEPPAICSRPARVLVMGGSTGNGFLDTRAPQLLGALGRRGIGLHARHQTNAGDTRLLSETYAALQINAEATGYVEQIVDAYRWADFVIARPGAVTIAELALCGLPALLVPLGSASDDHQAANAAAYADTGAALWTTEQRWSHEDIVDRVEALFRSEAAWCSMVESARAQAMPHAAAAIVESCEALMHGCW